MNKMGRVHFKQEVIGGMATLLLLMSPYPGPRALVLGLEGSCLKLEKSVIIFTNIFIN